MLVLSSHLLLLPLLQWLRFPFHWLAMMVAKDFPQMTGNLDRRWLHGTISWFACFVVILAIIPFRCVARFGNIGKDV